LDGGVDLPSPTFGPPPGIPEADASVRTARPADAGAIGAVQAAAWRASYAGLLPADVLEALDPVALGEIWGAAIAAPPTRQHVVLVASARSDLVGFAAVGPVDPAQDGVGEIAALLVTPPSQRQGHGSRLLNAAADLLRDNGFDRVVVWVPSGDDARLRFFTAAGFAADGAHRTLDAPGAPDGRLREQRLVASLSLPG
jgi:GNAT superfamily N-acetyltransferase